MRIKIIISVILFTSFICIAQSSYGDILFIEKQKLSLAPIIKKQLQVKYKWQLSSDDINILKVINYKNWYIVFINLSQNKYGYENTFLFYNSHPSNSIYIAEWNGMPRYFDEMEIEKWAIKNIPDIPLDLAKYFARYITKYIYLETSNHTAVSYQDIYNKAVKTIKYNPRKTNNLNSNLYGIIDNTTVCVSISLNNFSEYILPMDKRKDNVIKSHFLNNFYFNIYDTAEYDLSQNFYFDSNSTMSIFGFCPDITCEIVKIKTNIDDISLLDFGVLYLYYFSMYDVVDEWRKENFANSEVAKIFKKYGYLNTNSKEEAISVMANINKGADTILSLVVYSNNYRCSVELPLLLFENQTIVKRNNK